MKEFKIRCSSIGEIMTDGKTKGTLGKTAQTYLKTWMLEQVYNRKKQVSTKYMDKGLIMEDENLDFAGMILGVTLEKNQTYFNGDFITGTPDAITDDFLVELKSSWDFSTFPYFETECPNSDYYWQVQGYLHLTGLMSAKLIYVLSDTPLNIINQECKSYCFKTGLSFDDELPDFIQKMTYSDILPSDKIRIFDIDRNDEDIQRIIDRVKLCREYINQITKSL